MPFLFRSPGSVNYTSLLCGPPLSFVSVAPFLLKFVFLQCKTLSYEGGLVGQFWSSKGLDHCIHFKPYALQSCLLSSSTELISSILLSFICIFTFAHWLFQWILLCCFACIRTWKRQRSPYPIKAPKLQISLSSILEITVQPKN